MIWPTWLDEIWAKSPGTEGGEEQESLALHTFNVLKKLSELISLRPFIPSLISFPNFWNCLFWAVFLHDFGKSAKGFQDMLRGGNRWGHRHEVFSTSFLPWLKGFSEEELTLIASAILSHHKDKDELFELYPDHFDLESDPLEKVIKQFDDNVLIGLLKWLRTCTRPWIKELGLEGENIKLPTWPLEEDAITKIKKEGTKNIRYWLKAYSKLNKNFLRNYELGYALRTLLIRGHVQTADHMASAHVKGLPQIKLSLEQISAYEKIGLCKEHLYEHQIKCGSTMNSAILIAPTGSGKTEAALLWALNQTQNRYGLPRLYYTLPFQASMNAMYERLNSLHFPGHVGLGHSKNLLTLYRFFIEEQYESIEAYSKAKWMKELVRLHYYPIIVLSPYQILKAFYRIKGYETLLTDFIGASFIFDEIHAYEPDRLAMILSSMEFLRKEFKAKFFVMSATMPSIVQKVLLDVLDDVTVIKASHKLFNNFTRHKVFVLEGDLLNDNWINHICKQTEKHNSILICCNTVNRAQHVYSKVKEKLGSSMKTLLIHSRFNLFDRLQKEKLIKTSTGTRCENRQSLLLVSTQVIEVSMDVDFDVIFTDPAPLEALIQRFGRVNRRRLKEWAPVFVFTKPDDGQMIYDLRLIAGAIEILKDNHEKTIDEESVSNWLDRIYHGDILDEWRIRYQKSYKDFKDNCIGTLKPFSSSETLENMFYKAFDSIEVLPSCFEEAFDSMWDENPLEAAQLLVPIRWRQLQILRAKDKVRKSGSKAHFIVDCEYSSEFGLMF